MLVSPQKKSGEMKTQSSSGGEWNRFCLPRPTIFLGDSYSPVNVGGDIDCKVIRIDSGDFSQFKKLLLGLSLSHLVRLGPTGYITELAEFEDWVKVNLKGEVIPAINPFEEDLPVEWKITFNQLELLGVQGR